MTFFMVRSDCCEVRSVASILDKQTTAVICLVVQGFCCAGLLSLMLCRRGWGNFSYFYCADIHMPSRRWDQEHHLSSDLGGSIEKNHAPSNTFQRRMQHQRTTLTCNTAQHRPPYTRPHNSSTTLGDHSQFHIHSHAP